MILNKKMVDIDFSENIKSKLNLLRLGIIGFEAKIKPSDEAFCTEVSEAANKLRSSVNAADITKNALIHETRVAYKKCGKDPSRYRPSADSLMRRIIKGNDLYKVNNVVDCLNLISFQTGFSIGGYDLAKTNGNISLDIGTSQDEYYGIGRGLLNIEGMPVLRDNKGVFGSPTSDSERTMISSDSSQIAFVFFDFGKNDELSDAMLQANILLKNYAKVEVTTSKQLSL